MRFYKLSLILLSGVSVLNAGAQQRETYAENPSKRQQKAEESRNRFKREKEEARQFAQSRGMKMRHEDGLTVREFMAIRNDRPIYFIIHNKNAAISTAANLVRNTMPFNVDGGGVIAGVWDKGAVRPDHQEFGGRVTLKDGASNSSHATHVGGTIGAAGIKVDAKGMATGISIDSYDWSYDESEMISVAASTAWEPGKVMLSNHSYGLATGWEGNYWYGDSKNADSQDETFGQYSSYCREWDDILYNAPFFLPFVSAGNDRNNTPPSSGSTFYYWNSGWVSTTYNNALHPKGDGVYKGGYDTVSDKAVCKNTITVGAVNDAVSGFTRSTNNAAMLTFSSWGPTDDGRIKPDIVANGYALDSCDHYSTTGYDTKSGTSMATPNACGSAALLIDYYETRFPGQAMRASTLKGLILHTADDLGRPGPDYSYGWGLMNTLAAAKLIENYADGDAMRMTEAMLNNSNTSDSYKLFSDGVFPVRVTLSWTDPPATSTTQNDSRTKRLVNDLDLKIIGPNGHTFYPYTLDYNNPSANAVATGENNIDNVEQVFISVPAAGEYTIVVDFDGGLTGDRQFYSLIIDGTNHDSDDDNLPDYWESFYFNSATAAEPDMDSDGDGADNITEYISGHNPVDPSSVFQITGQQAATGGMPFVVSWDAVEGRVYSVKLSNNLLMDPFADNPSLSGDMPYPASSFTDLVERVSAPIFYQVEVRLAD